MTPREFFPTMPDEVFDMWLAPFIKQIGWPFSSLNDGLMETRWKYLLGNIPLSVWFSGKWHRVSININSAPVSGICNLMVEEIISNCTTNAHTMSADLQNTKERFLGMCKLRQA